MKRTVIALCAAALAAPLSFAVPAAAQGLSLEIGPSGPRVGFYTDGPYGYYGGYRGFRERRHGWRYYRGYWFPPDAFVDRRYTHSYVVPQRRHYRNMDGAHVEWCQDRYRSYRISDNSWQPYNGPRRQCRSPYG